MLEIRAEFRSREEWEAWRAQHHGSFAGWREAVLADVRQFGVVEPITGARHRPRDIEIDPARLRESVVVAGMSGRERAALFAIDLARRSLPPDRRAEPRILAAEGIRRIARVLRGAFPYFLGAEYLPTEAEQRRYFPIPHLDLMNAAFPDASFDLFYSGDVLEHVPDIGRALGEIARMLRPGGVMVSTFPFDPRAEATLRRASLDDANEPVHHLPAEYHGNPLRPGEGSLVFSMPGWDILEAARRAGFGDARMTLVVSSTFGTAASHWPGIFIMSAGKDAVDGDALPLPHPGFSYEGPRLRRVLGLVGLPRSGTTLLCSILGVHSEVEAVYEPYNANKNRTLPPHIGIDRFFTEFPTAMHAKEILLVKETGTQLAFLDRTAELLRSVAPPIERDLILLLRNPFHAFLSMLEARKKWWGGIHEVSADVFQSWARNNLTALARLLQMGLTFNALVVSYERLVKEKEQVVPALMRQLGLEFEDRQLDFEKYVDKRQVRGDITIAVDPGAISDQRVTQRALELVEVDARIKNAPLYPRVAEAARLVAAFAEGALVRCDTPAGRVPIRELRKILGA